MKYDSILFIKQSWDYKDEDGSYKGSSEVYFSY